MEYEVQAYSFAISCRIGFYKAGRRIQDNLQPRRFNSTKLSDFGKRLKPFQFFINPTSLAFRTTLPALNLFPTTLWAQLAAQVLRRVSCADLLGCEGRGYLPLRMVLAQYLRASRGVRCGNLNKSSSCRAFKKLLIWWQGFW